MITSVRFSTVRQILVAPWLALGIVIASGQVSAQTGSKLTENEKTEFLKVHNDARREVGSARVEWDIDLAKEAQLYANKLASNGLFEHAPKNSVWRREKTGENLGASKGPTAETTAVKKALTGWFGEKADFVALGTNGQVLSSHFSGTKQIGHYTQMVWQDTTKVGAGKAMYTKGPYKGGWVVVGRYSPGGNIIRRFAYGTPNAGSQVNTVGAGSGSNSQMAPGQKPDRSTFTQGDDMVQVKVANNTGQTVFYDWIDYDGKSQSQSPISSLGVVLKCYPGNLYRFRVDGNSVDFIAGKDPVQSYSIGLPSATVEPAAKPMAPHGSSGAEPTVKPVVRSVADLKQQGGVLHYAGVWDWQHENTSSFELDPAKKEIKYVYNGAPYALPYTLADNAAGNAVLEFYLPDGNHAQFEWTNGDAVHGKFWLGKDQTPVTQTKMHRVKSRGASSGDNPGHASKYSIEIVSQIERHYTGGGMGQPFSFRIKNESGQYVTDLEKAGLTIDVTSNNKFGKLDGNITNRSSLNKDVTQFQVYYYIPDDKVERPSKLRIDVAVKKADVVVATGVFEHDIK
ncbi:MAG: CAP domain-containing protein [Planctomycetaceae bacterium]